MFQNSGLYLKYKLICQKPAHFLFVQMSVLSSFLQVFIVLGMYCLGSTLPHFQQIPLTARHMLGKVFLSSLFLWHVMPFSPKKLWTDFFYYEKTWNGIKSMFSKKATKKLKNLPIFIWRCSNFKKPGEAQKNKLNVRKRAYVLFD